MTLRQRRSSFIISGNYPIDRRTRVTQKVGIATSVRGVVVVATFIRRAALYLCHSLLERQTSLRESTHSTHGYPPSNRWVPCQSQESPCHRGIDFDPHRSGVLSGRSLSLLFSHKSSRFAMWRAAVRDGVIICSKIFT